ncbi:hypothetical protein SH449x_005002 [Pirellulaceae bacterium SH449]
MNCEPRDNLTDPVSLKAGRLSLLGRPLKIAMPVCVALLWALVGNAQHQPSPSDRIVLEHQVAFLGDDQADTSDELTTSESLPRCAESEIFEVSTRHLSDRFCSIDENAPNFQVCKWEFCRWNPSTIQDALNGEDKLTIIYVHGNFMERNNTRDRVRIIDSYLKRQANENYRLILLSWPSEKQRPVLRDAAENAKVAERESLYLAWILKQLRSQSRVSLLGFSYGARTVTGALHLDAMGTIPGLTLYSPAEPRENPYRLGLIAPAVDKNWLTPYGRYCCALSQVDGFVNLYNSRDPVLRRFRFVDNASRPIAGGLNGFEGLSDPRSLTPLASGDSANVRQYDCGAIIGTTHSEVSYFSKCPYFRGLLDNVLWNSPSLEVGCSSCTVK